MIASFEKAGKSVADFVDHPKQVISVAGARGGLVLEIVAEVLAAPVDRERGWGKWRDRLPMPRQPLDEVSSGFDSMR